MAAKDPLGQLLTAGHKHKLSPGEVLKIWKASKKVYEPGMTSAQLTSGLKTELGATAFDWASILQLIEAILALLQHFFPPK